MACAAEGALHHGIDHLFGQRGAVHQHGVDTAGFGDERDDGAVFGGQRAVDGAGHRGRTGEHHTRNTGQRYQGRAHGVAGAV